jgi:hypothetical protein
MHIFDLPFPRSTSNSPFSLTSQVNYVNVGEVFMRVCETLFPFFHSRSDMEGYVVCHEKTIEEPVV